ncbi:MAG TPA: hypothetical protein VJJ21_03845 [Candidatus Nanoarchaeia archaeon]|nr:hypothetical protein [Candidatus Nanoarchaeia archaeon]
MLIRRKNLRSVVDEAVTARLTQLGEPTHASVEAYLNSPKGEKILEDKLRGRLQPRLPNIQQLLVFGNGDFEEYKKDHTLIGPLETVTSYGYGYGNTVEGLKRLMQSKGCAIAKIVNVFERDTTAIGNTAHSTTMIAHLYQPTQ